MLKSLYSITDHTALSAWLMGAPPKGSIVSPVVDIHAVAEFNAQIEQLKKLATSMPKADVLLQEKHDAANVQNKQPNQEPEVYKANDVLLSANFNTTFNDAVTTYYENLPEETRAGYKILETSTLDPHAIAPIYATIFRALAEDNALNPSLGQNNRFQIRFDAPEPIREDAPESFTRKTLSQKDCQIMAQLATIESGEQADKKITLGEQEIDVSVDDANPWSVDNAIDKAKKQHEALVAKVSAQGEQPNPEDMAKRDKQRQALDALLLYKAAKEKLEPLVMNQLKHKEIERLKAQYEQKHTQLDGAFKQYPNIFQLNRNTLSYFGENIRNNAGTYDLHLLPDGLHCYAARDKSGKLLGLALPKRAFWESHSFEKCNNFVLAAKKLGINKATIKSDDSEEAAAMYVSGTANGIEVNVKKQTVYDEPMYNNEDMYAHSDFAKAVNEKVQTAMQDLRKSYEQKRAEGASSYSESETASFTSLIEGIKTRTFSTTNDVNQFFKDYRADADVVSGLLIGVKKEEPSHTHETTGGNNPDPQPEARPEARQGLRPDR